MTAIEIADMPVVEKLKLMEALWDFLIDQPGGDVESPAWHGAVLEERLRRLAAGEEQVSPWKEAKDRMRSQAKAN
jgi:putative addiction module component (TIGR02574 family)